jgi:hypothetical protein
MLIDRMIGVLKLDVSTFEDIESDQNATSQAATVVLLVAILAGIGRGLGPGSFLGGFLSGLISVFVGWAIWSAVTYFVGTSLFGGQADMGEMLRVIGFAFTPQLLRIIPIGIVVFISAIWTLIVGFVAVRQGLDLDNTKAFLTIVLGLIIYIVLDLIMNLIFGL